MAELSEFARRYIAFGLMFVIAMVLAIRECVVGAESRGSTDEWQRVLWVQRLERADALESRLGGLEVTPKSVDKVAAAGRELLDDPDAKQLDAAIAYADEHGYGFVLVGLDDGWDLASLGAVAPAGARFAAISIGDVARQGTRVNFGAPVSEPIEYVEASLDAVAIQLALLEHPDLQALFHGDIQGTHAERTRWAMGESRGNYEHHLELLREQQQSLADVERRWPSGPSGNLGGRWERVDAVPMHNGVLLEITPVRLAVPHDARGTKLRIAQVDTLAFVPLEALEAGLDSVAARRVCFGTREHAQRNDELFWHDFEVAPDGRRVVVSLGDDILDIYQLASHTPNACELVWVEKLEAGERRSPRVSNVGNLCWGTSSQEVVWRDASGRIHQLDSGFVQSAHPRWAGDNLLVIQGSYDDSSTSYDAIMLLRTDVAPSVDSSQAPRALLDTSALFPHLQTDDPAARLIDVLPVGSDTLLVLTKACPGSAGDDEPRPCMYRVRFREPLRTQLGRDSMAEPITLDPEAVEVHMLGSIQPHLDLAISADGKRAVYVENSRRADLNATAFTVDIGATSLGAVEKIADQVPQFSQVHIGPDGRVVVVKGRVEVDGLDDVWTARAFVLPPPPG